MEQSTTERPIQAQPVAMEYTTVTEWPIQYAERPRVVLYEEANLYQEAAVWKRLLEMWKNSSPRKDAVPS